MAIRFLLPAPISSGIFPPPPGNGSSQVALVGRNLPANVGDRRDTRWILGSARSPGGKHGNPLQYSCLENLMDRGAWRPTVYGVAKS